MSFDQTMLISVVIALAGVFFVYRGVQKGNHARGFYVGFGLLVFWSVIRAYLFIRYGVVGFGPFLVPILALGLITYSASRRRFLQKSDD